MPPARHLALHALKAALLAAGIGACAADRFLTPLNRRSSALARRVLYRLPFPPR